MSLHYYFLCFVLKNHWPHSSHGCDRNNLEVGGFTGLEGFYRFRAAILASNTLSDKVPKRQFSRKKAEAHHFVTSAHVRYTTYLYVDTYENPPPASAISEKFV